MPSSDTLILGTRKGVMTLQRHAAGWKVTQHGHKGAAIPYALRDPRTGHFWASIDYGHWGGKLSRSLDGGSTWEAANAPKYPESAVVNDGFPGPDRKTEPATLKYLWVLAPGGADEPQVFYIGTEPGGLFRSGDGGESFELVEGLWNHPSRLEQWFGGGRQYPGIHSVIVDPRDSRHLFAGISCAGVFESKDAGASWAPRNRGLVATFLPEPDAEVGHDPHFLCCCPSAPDALWQQNHCGIFHSMDAGGSWKLVSQEGGPAHFGFAVAVDANDPNTAWVVPAQSDEVRTAFDGSLCACRTQDGGQSWETLRGGLPQADCYDIVFRHGLDVSGDRLAFGSTTGNVYVSDDRGESWQCLGTHFPPIYSVRFA